MRVKNILAAARAPESVNGKKKALQQTGSRTGTNTLRLKRRRKKKKKKKKEEEEDVEKKTAFSTIPR